MHPVSAGGGGLSLLLGELLQAPGPPNPQGTLTWVLVSPPPNSGNSYSRGRTVSSRPLSPHLHPHQPQPRASGIFGDLKWARALKVTSVWGFNFPIRKMESH